VKEGKVIALEPSFDMNRFPFLWLIYAVLQSEKDLKSVEDEINSTIKKYKEKLVSEDELNKLKSKLKYSFIMGMDTPDATAGNMARFIAITGGIEGIEVMYDTMAKITPEDIQKAAKLMTEEIKTTITLIGGAN
jgi:zinc protease